MIAESKPVAMQSNPAYSGMIGGKITQLHRSGWVVDI